MRRFSSKPSLGILLLFYHLFEFSNVLGVSQSCGSIAEGLSEIVSATQPVSAGLVKAIIILGKWDRKGDINS